MQSYSNSTGLFDTTGWWTPPTPLTAIIDNVRVTGVQLQVRHREHLRPPAGAQGGQFRSDYIDDTGWWARLGRRVRPDRRQPLSQHRPCRRGPHGADRDRPAAAAWWSTAKTYKNAIAIDLELNAALHNRIGAPRSDLGRANAEWSWFKGTGAINSSHLVNDGIDLSTCRNNGSTAWSYNQGVLLGGLAELYRATGDSALLTTGRQIGDASTTSASLNSGEILREPCESNGCGADGSTFKGAYVRGLSAFNAQVLHDPYTSYLARQADSAYANDRNATRTDCTGPGRSIPRTPPASRAPWMR